MQKKESLKPELKSWSSFDQQLDKLIANGLTVSNRQKALDYLARLGYYRLSGYWYGLRQLNQEKSAQLKRPYRESIFMPNSHFEQAVKLYVFDKKLRLMAMDALERIEMALRVDISYLLGRYAPLAHKKSKFLHGHFSKQVKTKGPAKGRTEHQVWLEKYEILLHRARREPFIVHHKNKYGELPIWVAIEVWDFGLMSKLYAGMLKGDQDKIATKYGAKSGRELAAWLRSLNFIRNVSAHHSRLWNINVLERAPIPKNEPNWNNLKNAKPFMYFCLLQKMMTVICPNSSWGKRLWSLFDEFPASSEFRIADFGLLNEAWVQRFFCS